MIVSEARLAANRRNAALSTGPKTEAGKARSRANALKHGLCSAVVVPESIEAIQERASAYYRTLKPQNEFQSWLVNEVTILSLRIERCERMERRVRDKFSLRSELTWDDDRKREAATLGGMIGKRPEEVVEALRRTPQGCEWLMARWAMLAYSADLKGCWTPEQTRLAFDLLGTPIEFREGHRPGASLDLEGKLVEPAEGPAGVARREIAALKERRDLVSDLDEVNRALACSDLSHDEDPELRRLRRYESALHRRLRWCLAQIKYESPHRGPHPDLKPQWVARIEEEAETLAAERMVGRSPVQVPLARQHWQGPTACPPFDLSPEEVPGPGEALDVPKILTSRAEKRLRRAEGRREARRRKLERLRA
ncbi:hypothetical protein P12x_004687 [Tundrisphaera lichenicola]|uniref:hypothetical protein n=1 Tax=Tundrisphaera lichenicola TaxID=2029860 RepID=UPI003EBED392